MHMIISSYILISDMQLQGGRVVGGGRDLVELGGRKSSVCEFHILERLGGNGHCKQENHHDHNYKMTPEMPRG